MRILLVSTNASGGGAAVACLRLFDALRAAGLEVRLLTMLGGPVCKEHEVLARSPLTRLRYRACKVAERLQILYYTRGRRANLWRLSIASCGVPIEKHPWVQWADVVHLHWVSQGFLSLRSLETLAGLGKPIVWTLHDLWAATGGCHLPYQLAPLEARLCSRLAYGCGACPLISISPKQEDDPTARLYRDKAFLARPPFYYIAVSQAAREAVRRSPHFASTPIEVIAPPMPALEPEPQDAAPPCWHDPQRIYLLFAAARLDDEVKGEELLRAVCAELRHLAPEQAERLTLLLVGEHKGGYTAEHYALPTVYIGLVREVSTMRQLYGLATLTLSTSLFETFGQTLTEALGCGCPVVSFASGGPEDIIRSGENGYLVPAYDVRAYAEAVLEALGDVSAGRLRGEACRASVARFAPEEITQQHITLYRRLCAAEPIQ